MNGIPTNSPKSPKALVVEDNPANMTYLLFLLKKLNIKAVSAYSGEDALELLNNETVDCMLLDINLGAGISGLTLMETLRKKQEFANVPVIAVTAYYGGGMHEELLNKGFTDYLAKPYNFDQLKEILYKYFTSLSDAD